MRYCTCIKIMAGNTEQLEEEMEAAAAGLSVHEGGTSAGVV